jgi:membrane peptidoglycan carboxypeptidase
VLDEEYAGNRATSHRRGGSGGHRKRARARTRRSRRGGRRVLIGLLLLGGLGLVAAIAVFAIGYAMTPVPDPKTLATSNTSTLYYKNGKSVLGTYSFESQHRLSVPLDQVPPKVQDAFIAAENRTFWTDNGVSPTGIIRAAWNQFRGQATQGGSTITQQYVKNYYLEQDQTLKRKVKELFITLKVEQMYSKQEILQNYLNTSYYGRGAYGIEVAADAYFGKHAKELTPKEGAVLAALLRAPSNYDPAVDPDNETRLEGRYRYVLSGMASLGSIPAGEATTAKLPKIKQVRDRQLYAGTRGYLLEMVRNELLRLGYEERDIEAGGLKVTTTFDLKAQRAMEKAVKANFPEENAKGVHAGAAAVRPGTGAVVAVYGGRDYLKQAFNDATQAKLQPGSTFKAFALASALEEGISLKSRFAGNSPYKLDNGDQVNNEFNTDYGEYVDLMQATRQSINTAYVDLTENAISPGKVVDAAHRAGIPENTEGLDRHAKVALGFASVRPIDMANAYATFAIGGQRASWHVVEKVTLPSGEVDYEADPKLERQFESDVVRDVNAALQDVVKNGTAEEAASKFAVHRDAAGKTGTHEDLTAWFVGYTPQLSAAVAFYKDANGDQVKESLDNVGGEGTFFGGGYPARIWTSFMTHALHGEPYINFPPAAHIGKTMNPKPKPPPPPPPQPEPEPTPTVDLPGPDPKPTLPFPRPTEPEPEPTDPETPPPPDDPDPEPTRPWPRFP